MVFVLIAIDEVVRYCLHCQDKEFATSSTSVVYSTLNRSVIIDHTSCSVFVVLNHL